jgi:putative endonuclease
MEYYVYILQSDVDDSFYKGYTSNLNKRVHEHNAGLSRYTSKKAPWKLVYFERLKSKTLALQRERKLKHANTDYIKWLIVNFNKM